MGKLKRIVDSIFSKEDFRIMAEEYISVSEQIKALDARKKQLSENLKKGAEMYGVKDDNGSFYCESDSCIFGKVAKKSMKINQEKAVEVLRSLNMGDLIDEVTTYTVNTDKLESAVQSGKLSLDVVEGFTDVTTSYAVSVKPKEEVAEVEQTLFKKASKKK